MHLSCQNPTAVCEKHFSIADSKPVPPVSGMGVLVVLLLYHQVEGSLASGITLIPMCACNLNLQNEKKKTT